MYEGAFVSCVDIIDKDKEGESQQCCTDCKSLTQTVNIENICLFVVIFSLPFFRVCSFWGGVTCSFNYFVCFSFSFHNLLLLFIVIFIISSIIMVSYYYYY